MAGVLVWMQPSERCWSRGHWPSRPSGPPGDGPEVLVFGTSGYAAVHLRHARALHDTGDIAFAGACDVREPSPEAKTSCRPARFSPSAQELFDLTAPDIAVVATPPHTHLQVG